MSKLANYSSIAAVVLSLSSPPSTFAADRAQIEAVKDYLLRHGSRGGSQEANLQVEGWAKGIRLTRDPETMDGKIILLQGCYNEEDYGSGHQKRRCVESIVVEIQTTGWGTPEGNKFYGSVRIFDGTPGDSPEGEIEGASSNGKNLDLTNHKLRNQLQGLYTTIISEFTRMLGVSQLK